MEKSNLISISIGILLLSFIIQQEVDIPKYFELVHKAENLICHENYNSAVSTYKLAFKQIDKPFGKDIFNAALACALSKDESNLTEYLEKIVNNSDDLEFVKSVFVGNYVTKENWDGILSKKKAEYNPELRQEFKEILERDQLFRPMYETHDDTINLNRVINLNRINELTETGAFPSHQELGYTEYLRGQNHDIVLHHTAQRRSRNKSVIDLESILKNAVTKGRFDPETAIFYISLQNDLEKGRYEVYSTWQYKHPLFPDSLNNKVWLLKLNKEQIEEANRIRKEWNANTLNEIAMKTAFLTRSNLPFIFTCVQKSVANFGEDMDIEVALKNYRIGTSFMQEYKEKL